MTNLKALVLGATVLTFALAPVAAVKAAVIAIDESKQAFAASGPVTPGYWVLCDSIPPQQGVCGPTSISDIVVFNGGAAISFFSDDDKSGIPLVGDHDAADQGVNGKAGEPFTLADLAIVAAFPGTLYFDETVVNGPPGTPLGTVDYTPVAGDPGFPIAAGVAADRFIIKSDCSDCSCGTCPIPEPLSLPVFVPGLVAVAILSWKQRERSSRSSLRQ